MNAIQSYKEGINEGIILFNTDHPVKRDLSDYVNISRDKLFNPLSNGSSYKAAPSQRRD